MTRLSPNPFAVLAAVSVLAMAAVSPAAAQAPAHAAAAAPAQATDRSVAVEGGVIRYQVVGDLTSGKTPVLVLHGAFMSIDTMKPLTDLLTGRPLIVVDQRGHGRTGDLPGPITYEALADDAAAVLADAGVGTADVVGYSMGAGAALQLALRHPERVKHLVVASVSFNEAGNLPGFIQMMDSITPEIFAGTPMEAEFKRLSPNPEAFPSVVNKIKVMDQGQDWPAEQNPGPGLADLHHRRRSRHRPARARGRAVPPARRRRHGPGVPALPDRGPARAAGDPAGRLAHRRLRRSSPAGGDGPVVP